MYIHVRVGGARDSTREAAGVTAAAAVLSDAASLLDAWVPIERRDRGGVHDAEA